MTQPVETPSGVHVEVTKGDPVGRAETEKETETGNGGVMVTTVASTTGMIIIGNGHTTVAMDQVRTQLIRPKG